MAEWGTKLKQCPNHCSRKTYRLIQIQGNDISKYTGHIWSWANLSQLQVWPTETKFRSEQINNPIFMERKLSASFVNKTFQQQLSPGQLQESKLGGISPSQQVWQQLCRSGLQSIPRHFIRRGGAHHKVKGEKKLQILPSFPQISLMLMLKRKGKVCSPIFM